MTGESVRKEKSKGNDVFAGTILENDALDIEMTKAGTDTVFSRIISLVKEAESSQAPIEKFTDISSSGYFKNMAGILRSKHLLKV
ncbi:MAG TPA: hypothetical protein VF144_07300 [Chitinophagaceae bacterium]